MTDPLEHTALELLNELLAIPREREDAWESVHVEALDELLQQIRAAVARELAQHSYQLMRQELDRINAGLDRLAARVTDVADVARRSCNAPPAAPVERESITAAVRRRVAAYIRGLEDWAIGWSLLLAVFMTSMTAVEVAKALGGGAR